MHTPEHKRWDCEEDRQANKPMDKAIVGVGREEKSTECISTCGSNWLKYKISTPGDLSRHFSSILPTFSSPHKATPFQQSTKYLDLVAIERPHYLFFGNVESGNNTRQLPFPGKVLNGQLIVVLKVDSGRHKF